jgi:hypothetical protein
VNADNAFVFEVKGVGVLDVDSANSLSSTVPDKSSVRAGLYNVSIRPTVKQITRRANILDEPVSHLPVDVDYPGAVTATELTYIKHVTKDFTVGDTINVARHSYNTAHLVNLLSQKIVVNRLKNPLFKPSAILFSLLEKNNIAAKHLILQ